MITLHHLENSRSQRILWLLEELQLPYQIKRYQRNATTLLAPPELKAVHPLGKSPVISDGDITVAESGAIIEYLLARYGNGQLQPPADSEAARQYRYWLHYTEGSAMPPLLMHLVFSRLSLPPVPWLLRPLAGAIARGVQKSYLGPQIRQHVAFMEAALAESGWFAGDTFSAADIQMSFPLEAAQARGFIDARQPRLLAWLQAIHARPAYQRALAQGGPYSLLR